MENIESRIEDIAIGLSVSSEKIKLVYEQVKKKDRMDSDDLRQLQEIGMPLVTAYAKLIDKTTSSIAEFIKEGRFDFKMLNATIHYLTNEGGLFYDLKNKQSQTLGHQYKKALKQIVINAYNAGWKDSENKGLNDYSAEKYYKENFE